jgi:hypothetical protein
MSDPVLEFTLDSPGKERLVVDGDGMASYLVLSAAHPGWASRAGLFRTQLTPPEIEGAASIARELVATSPMSRGRTGPVVTATVGDREATHPLEGPAGPAAELLSDLIERVREHPVAVVTLAAEAINGVDVRLKFENIGTESVNLRIARDSCRLSVRSREAWTTVWRSTASTRLALVAQPQGFLDGVNSMAILAPGMVARAMLPGALSEAGEPSGEATVELHGWVDIEGLASDSDEPDPLEDSLPGVWPFRLTTPAFSWP